MNTSMTINATAMWLLALYQVVAEEQAGSRRLDDADIEAVHGKLAGTTQNDIIKEYLSRGTYVFPPEHSLRLTSDLIAYTVNHIPKWNPINICSYHLQEAGATPDAGARLRAVHRDRGARHGARLRPGRARGLRQGRRPDLVLRQRRRAVRRGDVQDARLRASCGTRSPGSATASQDPKMRRFRYGVQVNSPRPDRGAAREQRAAHRAGDARRHAVQGRPRPRRPAAGVERGARPAAAVGPAVVAAAAAGAGLRVRPAGVRRHLRGLDGGRGQGRRAGRAAPARRWTGCRRWAARSRRSSPAT